MVPGVSVTSGDGLIKSREIGIIVRNVPDGVWWGVVLQYSDVPSPSHILLEPPKGASQTLIQYRVSLFSLKCTLFTHPQGFKSIGLVAVSKDAWNELTPYSIGQSFSFESLRRNVWAECRHRVEGTDKKLVLSFRRRQKRIAGRVVRLTTNQCLSLQCPIFPYVDTFYDQLYGWCITFSIVVMVIFVNCYMLT